MIDIDAQAPEDRVPATVYEVVHTTVYSYSEEVPVCHNEVHLRPRDTANQQVLFHAFAVDPPPATSASRSDWFGNHVTMFTIGQVHLRLAVTSTSRVAVAAPPSWQGLPRIPWEEVRDRAATSPAAAAIAKGPPPRYGTCTSLKPPARCTSSIVKCARLPLPMVP